jgi:enoyl-CoA hydratase
MNAKEYNTIVVTRQDGVATIQFKSPLMVHDKNGLPPRPPTLREIGMAVYDLRFDNEVRVIVITGKEDVFMSPAASHPNMKGHSPGADWDVMQALHFTLQQMIEAEKPIVAKVNGLAKGFGSSLVFACDFIVAANEAVFCDHHLGMGDGHPPLGHSAAGIVPGDGGTAFVPLHMSPPLAREYLWLARTFTGKELAALGAINRSVPRAELDGACDAMVAALMRRPPYALAMAKRCFNKAHADRFNLVFDLSWSYEMMNFTQEGHYQDGRGTKTL